MIKKCCSLAILCLPLVLWAQDDPNPEYSNEVYLLHRDSAVTLVRLEKADSKMTNKTKAAGLGGTEVSYSIDRTASPVRIRGGEHLSFVFWNGSSPNPSNADHHRDSVMKANGVDPSMMQQMDNVSNPLNSLTLYKTESGAGSRKIILQKVPGSLSFGSKHITSSEKYTFSVRQVRRGYWEIVVDKTLPAGEYAFTINSAMLNPGSAMDNSIGVFAFGVDPGP